MMKLTELVVNGQLELYSGATIFSWPIEQASHNQAKQAERKEPVLTETFSQAALQAQYIQHRDDNEVFSSFMAAVWNFYF